MEAQQLTLQDLRLYSLQQEPQKVAVGMEGFIYRISENHVAKIPHDRNVDEWLRNDESAIESIVNEYKIARELFDGGVCVPKPEGVFNIHMGLEPPVLLERGRDYPGFVMEYIPGESLEGYMGRDYGLRVAMYDEELEKAEELGFLTIDAEDCNGIWSPVKGKVYICDFGEWRRKEDVH